MSDRFCLTPLEAAEMAGIEINDVVSIARSEDGIAIEVDGHFRIDPDALTDYLGRDLFRAAA